MDPDHMHILRLPRRTVRMGQHVWLLLATIVTELLAITKWGKGQYPNPLPKTVKWGWMIGAVSLVLYPILQVGIFHFGCPCSTRVYRFLL